MRIGVLPTGSTPVMHEYQNVIITPCTPHLTLHFETCKGTEFGLVCMSFAMAQRRKVISRRRYLDR